MALSSNSFVISAPKPCQVRLTSNSTWPITQGNKLISATYVARSLYRKHITWATWTRTQAPKRFSVRIVWSLLCTLSSYLYTRNSVEVWTLINDDIPLSLVGPLWLLVCLLYQCTCISSERIRVAIIGTIIRAIAHPYIESHINSTYCVFILCSYNLCAYN